MTTQVMTMAQLEELKAKGQKEWGSNVDGRPTAGRKSLVGRKSIAILPELDENDDAAEKEQRRKTIVAHQNDATTFNADRAPLAEIAGTKQVNQGSAHSKASYGKPNVAVSLAQMASQYSQWFQMVYGGKVNTRTAWDVALIEHADEMMKMRDLDVDWENGGGADGAVSMAASSHASSGGDSTNFRLASCVVEAMQKVYGYRVESVYNEILKFTGQVNRTVESNSSDQQQGDVDKDDDDDDNEDNEDAGDHNGPDGKAGGAADDQSGSNKKAKKLKGKRSSGKQLNTLEENPEALNLKTLEMEFEVDPYFKKTSNSFDEGGARGLLLNNLSVLHGCHVVFDSTEVTMFPEMKPAAKSEQEPVATAPPPLHCPITPLAELKQVLQRALADAQVKSLHDLPLCAVLKTMHETGRAIREGDLAKPSDAAAPGGDEDDNEKAHKAALQPQHDDGDSDSDGAADAMDGAQFPDHAPLSPMRPAAMEEAWEPQAVSAALKSPPAKAAAHSLSQSSSTPMRALFSPAKAKAQAQGAAADPFALALSTDSDLVYVERDNGAWAGAGHWKYKANKAGLAATVLSKKQQQQESAAGNNKKRSQTEQEDSDYDSDVDSPRGKPKAGRKRKKPFSIDFSAPADPTLSAKFAPPPRSGGTLSEAALAKQAAEAEKLVLPDDIHFNPRKLQTLFHRPRLIIRLRPESSQAQGSAVSHSYVDHSASLVVVSQPVAEFGENDANAVRAGDNELIHRLAQLPLGHGDAGGGGMDLDDPNGDDNDDGSLDAFGAGAGGGAGPSEDRPKMMEMLDLRFTAPVVAGGGAAAGIELVSRPNTVDKIDINYAQFAKKVDVRALKHSIWRALDMDVSPAAAPASAPVPDKSAPQQPPLAPRSFQQTISALKSSLPDDVVPNLSVSYCFICLLHLANENDLTLSKDALPAPAVQKATPSHEDDAVEAASVQRHSNLGDFAIFRSSDLRRSRGAPQS